jgi:hypothetical protein
MMKRFRAAWVALAASALPGCGDECPALESCDIRRSECQAHTAAVAACLSGNGSVRPQVNVVDAPSYIEEQSLQAEAEPESDDDLAEERALALLALMPTNPEVGALTNDYWATVGAFYDPDTGGVTVLDRGQPLNGSSAVLTLLHEMVHAMQFQREQPGDVPSSDDDAGLARSAVLEGEATLYADLAEAFGYGYQPSEIDWESVYLSYQSRSWQQVIASRSAYSQASRYFPYAFGGAFLHRVWEQGGNAAVRDVFDAPPSSTREFLSGYGSEPAFSTDSAATAGWREDPNDVGSPILPAAYQPVSATHFGAWLFEIFRQRRLAASIPNIASLGQGYLGDVLNVFRGPGADEVTLYWRLRFESEARAEQLMQELDAVPAHTQLAHLQYGRDVAIAASTDRDLTAEDLRRATWGPVPAPVLSSDAAEGACSSGWRPRRQRERALYGAGPSSASDMLTSATACAGLDCATIARSSRK